MIRSNFHYSKLHPELPIFKVAYHDRYIIYAAGHFVLVDTNELLVIENKLRSDSQKDVDLPENVYALTRHARAALEQWQDVLTRRFTPECLTIYISNDCNLDCAYCFSKSNVKRTDLIDLETVRLAAALVASECHKNSIAFTLVLHGGGEPTYHWQHFKDVFTAVKEIAQKHRVQFHSYVATNGMLSDNKASWLAHNIDLIGVSCDGPANIQNMQRPLKAGEASSPALDKTIRCINREGGKIRLRVTVTSESMRRQSEIVTYLAETYNAQDVCIEPVYGQEHCFCEKNAEGFVSNFLKAEGIANKYGVNIEYSGVRMNDVHSTYCDIFRNTIRILPDGVATNCFCDNRDNNQVFNIIGKPISELGVYQLDFDAINKLRDVASDFPRQCNQCINQLHCARGCPDYCPVSKKGINLFKCKVNQLLMLNWLSLAAEDITP